MDCIFCKIVRGELPADVLYEDDRFVVILDKFPATMGHVLLIPKGHIENVYELSDEYAEALMPLVAKVARALKANLPLEGLNVLQNNGAIAGQTVFHYHLHLIPRYSDDGMMIKWASGEAVEMDLKEGIKKAL